MALTDLSKLVSKLQSASASLPTTKHQPAEQVAAIRESSLIFWGTYADEPYRHHLKSCVNGWRVYLRDEPVDTLTTVKMYCDKVKVYKVVSTSITLLKKLLDWKERKAPTITEYAGSLFKIPGLGADSPQIEIVFIQPLKQLVTIKYGKFLAERNISKFTRPGMWYTPTEFSWKLLDASNLEQFYEECQQAFMVAIDIETFKENAVIRCIGYTGFIYDSSAVGGIRSVSGVLPLDSEYNLSWMRKLNWELKAPKVFQNGKYDIAYCARYNAPVYYYAFDTANLFHSWYSELPKKLGFLNAFFIREAMYWKDLAATNDLHEYYRYNALDTWATGNTFLAMLLEAPDWAITNYLLEFPVVAPCHYSEMIGIHRDPERIAKAKAEQEAEIAKHQKSLDTLLDLPPGQSLNVNSPPQMKAVLKILGCGHFPSADETHLEKARYLHPLNARILRHVIDIRKARKLVSTYLVTKNDFIQFDRPTNRALYNLNPHGTDTSRLASKEHHFWCGINKQNIPRGPIVKQIFKADPGFALAEVDLEQNESRDTGYISGDANLIQNVEHSPDFHSANASSFFGVPFEEIYDATTGTVLNKPLRQLAKPVNHGANYNMGAYVLIDTMGEKAVAEARALLGLPKVWSLVEVANYLLEQFHKAYPTLRPVYYAGVIAEVLKTKMLTSQAHHYCTRPEDYVPGNAWTRYCFGRPDKSKPDLNAYVAHPPQSLAAQTLNKAYTKVFYDIQLHPEHRYNFKLLSQIHDSIFFQYRIGHSYLIEEVRTRMEIPVTIRAYDGVVRTFTVPASPKAGKDGKPAIYWSEIE